MRIDADVWEVYLNSLSVCLFVCTDNLISTDLTYLPYTNWFLFYKIIFYSEDRGGSGPIEEDEEKN